MVKRAVWQGWCVAAAMALAAGAGGCERESRPFGDLPAVSGRAPAETQSQLYAAAPLNPPLTASPYQDNAWAQSEGKRLFMAYNCVGCHANGGGGIGPPLMDDEWIYGWQPGNIFSTIVEGRPNGMPAFRSKIPDYQVWQIVAYVQSMSGQVPMDTSSGRSDHLQPHVPEIIQPYQGRTQTGHK